MTDETGDFWSIEYLDEEGETVIKHITGAPSEIKKIIDKLIENGFSPTAYRISVDNT